MIEKEFKGQSWFIVRDVYTYLTAILELEKEYEVVIRMKEKD